MRVCWHTPDVTCPQCMPIMTDWFGYPVPMRFDPQDWRFSPKCRVCGSTAIDHTERDCKANRGIVVPTPSPQRKRCLHKLGYASEQDALAAAEKKRAQYNDPDLKAYLCNLGGHYHLGYPSPSPQREEEGDE
jgi:hypothetical protein